MCRSRWRVVLQFLAGGAIGLLLGLLVGLSSSHVVATVVGAVSGGLLILLGLTPSGKGATPTTDPSTGWRLTGFGIVCALSLLLSVWIRAHHLLTPPIKNQVKELTDVGYSPDDARAWVAYVDSGVLMGGASVAPDKGSGGTAGSASSLLFSSRGKVDPCGLFTAERFKNQEEEINALQLEGGVWASYASYVEQLDPAGRNAALDSPKKLFCH
jgi:hypothetical protein